MEDASDCLIQGEVPDDSRGLMTGNLERWSLWASLGLLVEVRGGVTTANFQGPTLSQQPPTHHAPSTIHTRTTLP
jgi:hypothetical protein